MSHLSPKVKGAIQVGLGDAVVALPMGADGEVLTSDSTQASGLKYALAAPTHVETAHSLYAETTLPDTDNNPVFPSMIYDGAAVASIPVPSGKLVITDAFFGFGFVFWSIEVDYGLGAGFVTLAKFGFTLIAPLTTEVKRFKSPIVIQGGSGVAIRLRVKSPDVPATPLDVNATIRLYSEP
jgi:hypothetical protein